MGILRADVSGQQKIEKFKERMTLGSRDIRSFFGISIHVQACKTGGVAEVVLTFAVSITFDRQPLRFRDESFDELYWQASLSSLFTARRSGDVY